MFYLKQKCLFFQIEPFASLVNTVRSKVPRLLLNRHAVGPFERVPLGRGDHMELGDLADSVRRFAEVLGWNNEIEELMRTQEIMVSFTPAHDRNKFPLFRCILDRFQSLDGIISLPAN